MKRADLEKWSQIAGGKSLSTLVPRQELALRILDLPGVRELEGRLLLHRTDPFRMEGEVATVTRQLFGIASSEMEFQPPGGYWDLEEDAPEKERIHRLWDQHDEKLEELQISEHYTDDDMMELLAGLGLDFSDDRGHPLRCTKHMGPAAEAAARGIAGRIPDREAGKDARWEDALIQERDAFLAKKRRG